MPDGIREGMIDVSNDSKSHHPKYARYRATHPGPHRGAVDGHRLHSGRRVHNDPPSLVLTRVRGSSLTLTPQPDGWLANLPDSEKAQVWWFADNTARGRGDYVLRSDPGLHGQGIAWYQVRPRRTGKQVAKKVSDAIARLTDAQVKAEAA